MKLLIAHLTATNRENLAPIHPHLPQRAPCWLARCKTQYSSAGNAGSYLRVSLWIIRCRRYLPQLVDTSGNRICDRLSWAGSSCKHILQTNIRMQNHTRSTQKLVWGCCSAGSAVYVPSPREWYYIWNKLLNSMNWFAGLFFIFIHNISFCWVFL